MKIYDFITKQEMTENEIDKTFTMGFMSVGECNNEECRFWHTFSQEQINERQLARLRQRREVECFPIINRGKLWYDTLTIGHLAELNDWYHAWLNVTETKVVPTKPNWVEV